MFGIARVQRNLFAGHAFGGLHVVVYLVIKAAFQLTAHAGKLLWVERYVLKAGRIGVNRHEILVPCGATQLSSAGSCAAYAPCFLACANLFHFDTHVKRVCQHLNKLSEVYSFVRNVVENGLVTVALIFYIADFHLQSQFFCYLSALYHRVVFATLSLFVLV